jgi:hypothetical protein
MNQSARLAKEKVAGSKGLLHRMRVSRPKEQQ